MSTTTHTTTTEARRTLAKAAERHEAALAEVQRIAAAMRAESPTVEAARKALEYARTRVSDAEASHALGELEKSALEAAKAQARAAAKDLETAESAATSMASLSDGLRRRLEVAQAEEGEARAALTRAENALILAALVEADAAYTKAAEDLAKHAGRVLGLAGLLKRRDARLIPAATSSHLGMPTLPTLGPVSAGVAVKRGHEHGIRASLIEGERFQLDLNSLEFNLLQADRALNPAS